MSVLPSIAPRRRTFTKNVFFFLALGAMALGYLTFVGARPDLVAAWRERSSDTHTVLVETQRNVERALADLDPIKQGVGEMKMEVDNMKTGIQEAMERDRVLLEKVETLERTVAQPPEKVAAAPAPAAPKKQAAAQPRSQGRRAYGDHDDRHQEHRNGQHRREESRRTSEAGARRRAAGDRPVARTRCGCPGKSSTTATVK